MKKTIIAIVLVAATGPSLAQPATKGKVLVVLSSTSTLQLKDNKTVPTGYYLGELAVPAQRLQEAGYEIVVATPEGNKPAMDERSNNVSLFNGDAAAHKRALAFVENHPGMRKPEKLRIILRQGIQNYAGIYVPGGHAPLNDLMQDPYLGSALRHFHHYSKPTAFLCHGPVAALAALPKPGAYRQALVSGDQTLTTASAASWPYAGYRMTVFSNEEEKPVEEKAFQARLPFYAADALRTAGAKIENGPPRQSFVIRDRELITGQNPASDHAIADALLQALNERQKP